MRGFVVRDAASFQARPRLADPRPRPRPRPTRRVPCRQPQRPPPAGLPARAPRPPRPPARRRGPDRPTAGPPARPPLATATHGTCSIGASAPVFRDDFPAWRRRMRPSGQTVTRLTGQIVALAAAAPAGPRAPRAALRACPARAARRGGRALGRRAARRRGRDRVAYGAGFRAQRPPQARGRAPRGEPIGGAAAVGPGPRRRARARSARLERCSGCFCSGCTRRRERLRRHSRSGTTPSDAGFVRRLGGRAPSTSSFRRDAPGRSASPDTTSGDG